jgi:cyclopropane fatty-acyl-phospholipid synthase-like methyltransferase
MSDHKNNTSLDYNSQVNMIISELRSKGWKYSGVGSDFNPWSDKWCDVLLSNTGLFKNGMKLIDWGCGYGRVYMYLNKHFTDFTYYGFELPGEYNGNILIETARKKYQNDTRAHFDYIDSPSVDTAFKQCNAMILGSVVTHLSIEDSLSLFHRFLPFLENGGIVVFSTILSNTYLCKGINAYLDGKAFGVVYNTINQIEDLAKSVNCKLEKVGTFDTDHKIVHTIFKIYR